MSGTYVGDLIILFLVSSFVALVLSFTVSKRMIWVPVIFCINAGFSLGIGFSAGNVQTIFIGGLIFGPLWGLLIVYSGQSVKNYRERALKKLNQMDRDLTMDDLFENKK